MALKYIIDTLDGIEQHVASLYEKSDDGKFRLDVDGVVPREKLDEFRNTNIELLRKVDSFKGIDPQKYQNLLGIEKRLTDKELIEAGKVDEVVQSRVQSLTEEHNTTVSALKTELGTANSQLEGLLIDSAVRLKALEAGVLPTAVDDVMLRAKTVFKIIEGRAVPHADGKPIYGKDGINPMSVDEWVTSLAKTATHLFGATQGANSQGSRTSSRLNKGQQLTSIQKIASGLGS